MARCAEAKRDIREAEVVTLPNACWQVFFDALVDPPLPNETLKTAFRRYREASKQGSETQ